jgi:S1-C subfamily serine protease
MRAPARLPFLAGIRLLPLLGFAACASPTGPGRDPVEHARPVVRVRFTARRPAGAGTAALEVRRALGSGFVLDAAGHVVTSHHGVDLRGFHDATYMIVVDEGATTERTYPARLLHHDVGGDLALLALIPPYGTLAALPLAERAARGEPVRALGYPRHAAFRETRGTVIAIRPATRFRSAMVEADAPVAVGNSGGPLVDSAGGVVGVVVRSNGHVLHAVPVDYLRRRLRQWRVSVPAPAHAPSPPPATGGGEPVGRP